MGDSDDNISGEHNDEDDEVLKAMGPGTVKSKRIDEKGREYVSYDVVDDNRNEIDTDDVDKLLELLDEKDINDYIRMEDNENVLNTLTEEQIAALQSLEDDNDESNGSDMSGEYHKTAEEVKEALSKVPGLTD